MKVGTVVLIKDPAHPWADSMGTLGESVYGLPGIYEVQLVNGMRAVCFLGQLEDLESPSQPKNGDKV